MMQRNSTTLFLQSPGAITPIPWVNNAPDFSLFTEPTLSVLQDSWQAFLDSGEALEVIPDPEPYTEPIVPNWLQFYKQLKISATYQYLIGLTISAPNISGVMAALGIAIQDGIRDPQDPDILPAFQAGINGVIAALNAISQPLTAEQLAEVRALLDVNDFNSITLE